jgi:hypothetical protein
MVLVGGTTAASVLNESVVPFFCPLLFQAYAVNLYVVLALSPVTEIEMDTAEVPAAIALVVFVSPSAGVHWNQLVVASPPGLTVPLNVAEVDVTLDAASVVTVGAAVVVLVAAGAYVAAGANPAPMLSTTVTVATTVVVIFHFIINLS